MKWINGPWSFTYDGSSTWSVGESHDPQVEQICVIHDTNDERARAIAFLLSSAPEMLSALKALYESVDSAIELTPEVMRAARDAIAMAEGKVAK